MTRTLTTATAIATVLVALAPAVEAGQVVNVAPQPKVNIAPKLVNVPNLPRPQVNRPDILPRPDTSRVRIQDPADDPSVQPTDGEAPDEDEGAAGSTRRAKRDLTSERTQALADHAPIPPAFPETLVKAMDVPPFRPWPEGEAQPGPWLPEEDDEPDDGHADHLGDAGEIDTGGSGDAPGIGDTPPLGQGDAERLREQFPAGPGVERAEELARLGQLKELGWLEFGDGAFGGDGDCGPGVNLPAGTDLPGLGCGSGDESKPGPSTESGGDSGVTYPFDPRHEGGRYPRPSPTDSMGGNKKHDNAWIGGGSSSAKGNASVSDFGQGRAAYPTWPSYESSPPDAGGCSPNCTDNGVVRWVTGKAGGKAAGAAVSKGAGKVVGGVVGNIVEHLLNPPKAGEQVPDLGPTEGDANGDGVADMSVPPEDDGSSGGEAGQPDPRGPQTGGGAGQDCLMLGTRCDVAENESGETWGEKMKEWARTSGLGGGLTPGKVMEQAGQPVPVPGRDSATGDVADPRAEAGLTPGCDADPGGCGGGVGGTEAAGAAAEDALGDVSIDVSIAGMTPGCDASPDGCGGSAAAEAAVETGAGEEAR